MRARDLLDDPALARVVDEGAARSRNPLGAVAGPDGSMTGAITLDALLDRLVQQ